MSLISRQKTKLLAINFGGIGDEVLFLPTLQSIRREHPDWHITLLLEPRSRSIKEVTNMLDDLLVFDIKKRPLTASDLIDLVSLLRNGSFDVVLSSGASPAVAVLLFLSGITTRIGYATNPLSRLLLTNPVELNSKQYAANMYHDLARGLGINAKPQLPDIIVPPENLIKLKTSFAEQKTLTRTVLIHPGTSTLARLKGIIKTWPASSWASLIKQLTDTEIPVALAGGPDDAEAVNNIMSLCQGLPLISFFGLTKSLADLAALIQLCNLLVCVDSAPMHLAVALNKPLVALFGPTSPKKLLPASKLFKAISDTDRTQLDKSCELNIAATDVFQAVLEQMERL